MKKKTSAKRKRRQEEKQQPRELGHEKRFDQLLDDAIFGVKKPPKRG